MRGAPPLPPLATPCGPLSKEPKKNCRLEYHRGAGGLPRAAIRPSIRSTRQAPGPQAAKAACEHGAGALAAPA